MIIERRGAVVLIAAALCLLVMTMNHEALQLPGEFSGSSDETDVSFVRMSGDSSQINQQSEAHHSELMSDNKFPAKSSDQPGAADISTLVQEDLDWLSHNSAEFAQGLGSDTILRHTQYKANAGHMPTELPTQRAPEDFEETPSARDTNSIVAAEMVQVNDMQLQQMKDFHKGHDVAATLTQQSTAKAEKTLSEAEAPQKKMDEIQHEERQVESIEDKKARENEKEMQDAKAAADTKAAADAKPAAAADAKAAADAQAATAQPKAAAQPQAAAAESQAAAAIDKLRQKRQIQRRRIQEVSKDLMMQGAATIHAVVASIRLEASRQRHEMETIKIDKAVDKDIPREIPGLEEHFRADQEAALRQASITYNKIREKVVDLNHKLTRLEQEAADAAAKKKFDEDQEEVKAVLARKKDQTTDELSLARFPKDYRDKITAMQQDMWAKKMKQFQTERDTMLQQQVDHDDALVNKDEEEIAEVKQRLKQVIHPKLNPVQTILLEEDNVGLDTASAPIAPDPRGEMATIVDLEQVDPERVIELLAHEVAVLQKQQSHLVAALASKRMAGVATSTLAHMAKAGPKKLIVNADKLV